MHINLAKDSAANEAIVGFAGLRIILPFYSNRNTKVYTLQQQKHDKHILASLVVEVAAHRTNIRETAFLPKVQKTRGSPAGILSPGV
jgi:hypothetical protein